MNATDATTPVTDAANAGDVTAIFCPECGDDIEDVHRRTTWCPGCGPGTGTCPTGPRCAR